MSESEQDREKAAKEAKEAKKRANVEMAKAWTHTKIEDEVYKKYKDTLKFCWLTKRVLSPVRDQKRCNCCWAIATAASMESEYAIGLMKKYKTVPKLEDWQLAPQELIDCYLEEFPKEKDSVTKDNKGCFESSFEKGFKYVDRRGIHTEKVYPFQAKKGDCQCNTLKGITKFHLGGKKRVNKDDKEEVNLAIREHPILCSIKGTLEKLLELGDMDEDDIFEGNTAEEIKNAETLGELHYHALLIVGYGVDKGKEYFLVKNSWGLKFGKYGYGRIARSELVGQMRSPYGT